MYKILGSDGNEYESLSAEKIKQWIRENRVDQKTPVMPDGADDWVFLGALPEFAEAFGAAQKTETGVAKKRGGKWKVIFSVLFLLVIVVALFVLKRVKTH